MITDTDVQRRIMLWPDFLSGSLFYGKTGKEKWIVYAWHRTDKSIKVFDCIDFL